MKKPKKRSPKPLYVLEAQEMNFWWKLGQSWWFIPKARVLRSFVVYHDRVAVTMWNGDTHELRFGSFTSRFSMNPNEGDLRTITVTKKDGSKFKIREMIPMYPQGEEDFDIVTEVLRAKESLGSKVTKAMKKIRDGLEVIKD